MGGGEEEVGGETVPFFSEADCAFWRGGVEGGVDGEGSGVGCPGACYAESCEEEG